MRFPSNLGLALLGLAATVFAQDDPAVSELDRASFKRFVENNDVVLAEFYAPWCGHCVKFAPRFEAAAKTLQEMELPVRLARVDCTKQNRLCQDYGIRAYPTMKIFKYGQELYHDYDGPRRSQAIVEFMAKQILPTVSVLDNKQAHDNFLFKERGEVAIVGYIDSSDTASNSTLFAAAEKLHEDFPIGVTSDLAAAQAAGVTFPSIVLYKPENDGKEVFDKTWDVEAIKTFAKNGYTPLIGEVGADTWRKYVEGSSGPTAFIFAKSDADRKRLAAELRPLAKKHAGALQFATAEIPDFAGFAAYLHLRADKDEDFPAFGIYDGAAKKKYPFSGGSLDARALGQFADDFVAGRLQPSVKSQPIPTTYDGPVTSVVANNFQEVVMDAGKDVLLYYFREDCPYCKALAPVYETLASLYSAADRADKVVIAKMDVLKNDVPENIPYVPYIKLFKAGADKASNNAAAAAVYMGDRSVKDLLSFVKDQGTHHVEGLHEHDVADDVIHSGGGGDGSQKPFALHEPPLQGSTPMRHIHDEL